MRRLQSSAGALSVILLLGAPHLGRAQTPAPAAAPAPAMPPAQAPQTGAPSLYYPSMGDLMTILIQPRHLKLGLAGKAENWVYAAYELTELRNAFGRIAHTIPKYRTTDTAQMIGTLMLRPLNQLDHAIIDADPAKFTAAYALVTQACNACHAAQEHPMVVIKVPDRSMFPDQDFRRKP